MRYYWIVPPRGNHKSFRIMSQLQNKYQQVRSERLDSINKMYRSGTIDAQVALTQVEQIVTELRAEQGGKTEAYLDGNVDIFERYFREEYETRDILPRSLKAARASFRRALALLGNDPISTVSEKEVQKRIYALPYKKRNHVVLALNALFKFAGRQVNFSVGENKAVAERVRHLTLGEFQKVLPHIENPLVRALAGAAFATGCRVGELFSLAQYNETTRVITVRSQFDQYREERPTKTRTIRTAVVVAQLDSYVKEWLAIPVEARLTIRNVRLSAYMRAACQKEFPTRVDKHCHFYDLRHSYAIHFLGLGVSLDLIATALGNSPDVCRKHYTGYILSDGGTTLMNLLQEKKAS